MLADVLGTGRLQLVSPAFIDPTGNHRPSGAVVLLYAFPAKLDVALAEVGGTGAVGALAAWQRFAGVSQGLRHATGGVCRGDGMALTAVMDGYRLALSHGAVVDLNPLRRPAFDMAAPFDAFPGSELPEVFHSLGDKFFPAAFIDPPAYDGRPSAIDFLTAPAFLDVGLPEVRRARTPAAGPL